MIKHPLLLRQLRRSTDDGGSLDVDALLALVEAAYFDQDDERRRSERANAVVSEELEGTLDKLQSQNESLVEARKIAEVASASKSAFLANMSHEIRTPLNGVMGMAQVLQNTKLDEQQDECVDVIISSGEALMVLLNDVLDLSKVEAGKIDIVMAEEDLHALLKRMRTLWLPRAEEKGIELNLSFDSELPSRVKLDIVRVQQCLSNLISNAIKFTDKGRVDVTAKASLVEGSRIRIDVAVSDTGQGIDKAALARLFQPFTQADETITRRHGGTGLGLAIAAQMAELMGGGIAVESEPGVGSTFKFNFEAICMSREQCNRETDTFAAPQPARTCAAPAKLDILLVDDHPTNRQVVRLFLKKYPFNIVEATNGVEALDVLKTQKIDMVLLDMHMPVMDGPTALREIRASGESWADIPVLALTADAMSGDRERYMEMGVQGYLAKPISEKALISEIAQHAPERIADEPTLPSLDPTLEPANDAA